MKTVIKNAIEEYQCSGCVSGCDIKCFQSNSNVGCGVGCGKHLAGTIILSIGKIFLGMPKGFNRLGSYNDMKPYIFEKFDDCGWYNHNDCNNDCKFNIPVWKYLNENGHTLVRGISPRTNSPFIHIFLENCIDKIDCFEITKEHINSMN